MGQTMAPMADRTTAAEIVGRIENGVKMPLIAEFIYSLAAAAIMFFLYKPCLGLFFTGNVDLNAMIPWARNLLARCILVLCSIKYHFHLSEHHAGCGYGFLPMMGGGWN